MSETIRDVVLGGEALRLVRRGEAEDGAITLVVESGEERQETAASLVSARPGWITLRVGGRTRRARVVRQGQTVWVSVAGETYRFQPPRRGGAGGGAGGEARVEAPMPGTVLEVLVADGDAVEEGQDLLVVEAMKMEHRLKAGQAGVVQGLTCKAGDRVDAGVALLEVVAAS